MSFARRLAHGPSLLLDGGMGSLLMARGLRPGEAPERWNLERGEEVAEIHRAYVAAGCDAVQTNSFGAHPHRLAAAGLAADQLPAIVAAAVGHARAARARFVVGDVGPSGAWLPPVGAAEPEELARGFAALGRAFAAARVDALHVETMSDLREARLALAALREAAPGIPVMVSLTFEAKPRGFFTVMGDRLEPALAALAAAGAAAVGANCTLASGEFVALAAAARAAAVAAPLVFQPNAGAPHLVAGATRYDQDPETFADDVAAIARAGAAAVGGCCGTDPRFTAALARRLSAGGRR